MITFLSHMKREVRDMKKQIIAIGRQCGSGGHTIGLELSQRLHIPFYDKEYLDAAADQEAGYTPSCTSLLFCLATGMYDGYLLTKPAGENSLAAHQAAIIQNLAQEGPCVIVGRCADHILRDREDCLRVFVQGDKDDRIHRMVTEEGLAPDSAQRLVESRDGMRRRHYENLTGKPWGDPQNYDLVLDTTQLGIDRCIERILEAYQ